MKNNTAFLKDKAVIVAYIFVIFNNPKNQKDQN